MSDDYWTKLVSDNQCLIGTGLELIGRMVLCQKKQPLHHRIITGRAINYRPFWLVLVQGREIGRASSIGEGLLMAVRVYEEQEQ